MYKQNNAVAKKVKMKIQFEIKNKQVFFAVLIVSFITLLTLAIAITAVNPGHTSNDVIISIGGAEKTLQSAIDSKEIGASIFKDGIDGIVRTQIQTGWAKINIAGNSYVVPIYNMTESIVRVETKGQTLEGHKLNYYLCTYDDFRSYTQTDFCKAFGYSKGSSGGVRCGNTELPEYRHSGNWGYGTCSGQGLCYGYSYIVSIDCII